MKGGLAIGIMALAGCAPSFAQATLSVTPAYAYLTSERPHGSFQLTSEGTQPLEVVVTAEYGVIESDSTGGTTSVRLGHAGRLGDLTDRLTFFPQRLILAPGDVRVVRYMIEGAEALRPGGYILLMHYKMQERAAVGEEAIPAVATAISIEYSLVTPIVLTSGEGVAALTARLLSQTDSTLQLLLTNESAFPFAGGVSLVHAHQPIARVATAVYTRRRVELKLPGPLSPGEYVLQFDNDYPGLSASAKLNLRIPEPITIAL